MRPIQPRTIIVWRNESAGVYLCRGIQVFNPIYSPLEELIKPERIKEIKLQHLNRANNHKSIDSPYLLDILEDTEGDGCAACFI